MRVYRISKCKYIDDLSGTGASFFPGRWHNKGTHILYAAATASLAMLESIVHITSVVSLNMCMICLEVPENSVREIPQTDLPNGWQNNPSPDILKTNGDAFIRENEFLVLKVPSAILPEENNYLLNPLHKDFTKIMVIYNRSISIDNRFFNLKKI